MARWKWLCAAGVAACIGTSVQADQIDDVAAKFGARPTVIDLGVSPDGDQIFLVGSRKDGGDNVIVVDLKTKAATPVFSAAPGGSEQVLSCLFPLEDRLVCNVYLMAGSGDGTQSATRLVTIAADGSDAKLLSARAGSNDYFTMGGGGRIIDYNVDGNADSVLMTRYASPQAATGTLLTRAVDGGLVVEAVDLHSLRRKSVESRREDATDYGTDGKGHVRLMTMGEYAENGYAKNTESYYLRPVAGGKWQLLSTVTSDAGLSSGFVPIAVKPGTDTVYGFDSYRGNTALFTKEGVDGPAQLLLANPEGDVNSLLRIGRDQRIIGVTYATEKMMVNYFDKELAALSASLEKALPGNPLISFVDATKDEGKLIVFAGSDVDPGHYYMFDKETKQLGLIMAAREELAGMALAKMTPVTFPAADGTQIPGYLTLPPGSDGKNLPAIVMPHGGPSARDYWGFDWLAQYFAAQGYAVFQPNYRGSAGYGTKWFQKNGFQSWETAIGDVNDAGRWLQSQGIAAPGKLAIVGWSYGGYAALQSAVLDPDLYKAIIAIAPVTDLDRAKAEAANSSNRRIVENFIGSGPHIEAGSPARHADRFKAPVMLFHGDMDLNVAVEESRLMESRLKSAGKSVTYTEFDDLDHQLDDSAARTKLLADSDRFLRRALGIK